MPALRIENLKKSYGAVPVLNGIDLTVDNGDVVAVIGRSGSGKSTMLRCINGLEPFQDGAIEVAGHVLDRSRANLRELRKEVGMVFQSYNLFPHLSVAENITLAPRVVKGVPKEQQSALVEEVLARVDLQEKRHAFPDELSGGQQQRVAIARSLAMKPKVMLFDEVTSALDPELTGEVLKTIAELAQAGMTMVLVTHEMGFARRVANRTVFMHQGRIWEEGRSEELFANPRTPELQSFVAPDLK
ncbi:amino acid ABC transporter ATP-binding protein [Phyllobacterium sp. 0TCS1.6C]|uniref:amino acid ABC transporter ATP-binding protein n=1 Tax=unclassified Phyllobacterium TaxID=2638441 RepID=UPI0022647FBD|nr:MULTISPECIES: amino acid ABC transporter ATP-binding protein [unclassified Phyllobacterium]MCX8279048.1 amino acid ABC transporter ATP-binding protein [Phyllobacterium sp. 0TCS1.6C]MCX8293832.1 amino acid ABC transporter ATP-binding protein [Phyllobacterium sp. 0TCS1.6A]